MITSSHMTLCIAYKVTAERMTIEATLMMKHMHVFQGVSSIQLYPIEIVPLMRFEFQHQKDVDTIQLILFSSFLRISLLI